MLVYTAPLMVLMLVAAGAAVHVTRLGDTAVTAFASQDTAALRASAERLHSLGVVDAGTAAFADGDALVLEGRLVDAEARFAEALAQLPPGRSCPTRVNLELVRETLGDIAVRSGRIPDANALYQAATTVVTEAPAGCFDGNDDADEQRRALRADAKARLERKLAAVNAPPPPPRQTAPPVADQPPPPPGTQGQGPGSRPPGLPPISQRVPGPGDQPGETPPLPGEQLPAPPRPVPVPQAGPGGPQTGPGTGVADPNAPVPIRIKGKVGPDGVPLGDPNSAGPPLTMGPGDGDQLERLGGLLENANSYSGDRE